jgi:hypothetical protein
MQHLLDFIHEHTLEEQLYLVAPTPAGELELLWQRCPGQDNWQIRPRQCEGPYELIGRAELLGNLERRGVDMASVERELNVMAMTQIAFADLVLRDATRQLGAEFVDNAVRGHAQFLDELQAALRKLIEPAGPSMVVHRGGAAPSATQAPGHQRHLTLVRP